MHLLV